MQPTSLISLSQSSPSFNSYSSENLADIAARVIREFDFPIDDDAQPYNQKDDDDNDDDFEFAILPKEPEAPPISADDIFYNGQILPIYPIFNTALLLDDDVKSAKPKPVRLPLGKFFSQDRETTSCSSSEADDLENLPADTYCVWTPKKTDKLSDGRGKKSSSTGSSKRWKFRDLLYRSNSEGKEQYVFFSPAAKKTQEEEEKDKVKGTVQKHYVKSRAIKGGDKDKRRSFLPYRPDFFLPSS